MKYGIPLLNNRVSPRCTIADSVMLVASDQGRLKPHRVIHLEDGAWLGLIRILLENQVETLVTGGINRETKQMLKSYGLKIVDNVACSAEQLLEAVACDKLKPGYGFSEMPAEFNDLAAIIPGTSRRDHASSAKATWPREDADGKLVEFDCFGCRDRACLRGEPCYPITVDPRRESSLNTTTILEAARDISSEKDRRLCRLAELVYFCLGMKYKRVGVAFCIDLVEPAGVLTGLLRRFFEVFPVCCKVGGVGVADPIIGEDEPSTASSAPCVACNPLGQAEVLNRLNTDINIIVGLCMGVDCLFTQVSRAPVTTLFVKDKSLINNPIGAVYSDYYLNEATLAPSMEKMQDNKGGIPI